MYRYNTKMESSDSDFEEFPVPKKPLIEISDEEYEVKTYNCNNMNCCLVHYGVFFARKGVECDR